LKKKYKIGGSDRRTDRAGIFILFLTSNVTVISKIAKVQLKPGVKKIY